MLITHLHLKNWRNFTHVDVALQRRQFIVGPNASGKSNLLDVFRFLHDIAKQRGGGLQEAIEKRGGMSKIRCLSARRDPEVGIGVSLTDSRNGGTPKWRYEIGIKQETRGLRQPHLSYERVWNSEGKKILDRPLDTDNQDKERLNQTYLEQVSNNQPFREIGLYFGKITYAHLVPQLLRHSDELQSKVLEGDPFGQMLLHNIATTHKRTRKSRIDLITQVIRNAVPKFEQIEFEQDEITGNPHLKALYSNWRPRTTQNETQFSDGTLRLIGLLWSLLKNDSVLLLEEPELSLHASIVRRLAGLLYRAQQKKKRQVLISTHSADLLSNKGIGGEEILILTPSKEGTAVKVASNITSIVSLLHADISIGEAVISRKNSTESKQNSLFPL